MQHTACWAPSPILPKRLVEVSCGIPRLVETQGLPYSRYLTLSHCWGAPNNASSLMKTTIGNYDCRRAGIQWEEIPQIFKDAMALTKSIGCRWIWIDSLCIVQDDVNDWKEESVKMAQIYSNSFLNIAATFSSSSSGDYFSPLRFSDKIQGRNKPPPLKFINLDGETNFEKTGLSVRILGPHLVSHMPIVGHNSAIDNFDIAPLLQRAWVFQERLLAPRTLHLSASELVYECNSSVSCQCGEIYHTLFRVKTGVYQHILTQENVKSQFAKFCQGKGYDRKGIFDTWLQIVELYSSLSLTFVSDRAVALAGLASSISEHTKSEYFAGLWTADLPRSLLWATIPEIGTRPERKRISSTAPTWSWMSFYNVEDGTCSVNWNLKVKRGLKQDYRLNLYWPGIFCHCVDGDPFRQPISGLLEMSGAVVNGTVSSEYMAAWGGYIVNMEPPAFRKGLQNWKNRMFWLEDDCLEADGVVHGDPVLCLLLGTDNEKLRYVLVLRAVNRSTVYFKRIGIGKFPPKKSCLFDGVEVREIVII
ncbi:HET-domain-containing protein [Patellaria atrata CBS 101060]|uniref:HET-domain-containing protein n=1 Tax=Patellaria atrata CBS 101060 TaxID=1346257 RepID=A0A9P4VPE0_9PEZI|nr:HET-domain-containing protein [Patellaria atrata CBS 101060]